VSDFLLDREEASYPALEGFRPTMEPIARVDKLRRDADAVAIATQATLEQVLHAQLPGDFARIGRLGLRMKRRRSRRHVQVYDLRQ